MKPYKWVEKKDSFQYSLLICWKYFQFYLHFNEFNKKWVLSSPKFYLLQRNLIWKSILTKMSFKSVQKKKTSNKLFNWFNWKKKRENTLGKCKGKKYEFEICNELHTLHTYQINIMSVKIFCIALYIYMKCRWSMPQLINMDRKGTETI